MVFEMDSFPSLPKFEPGVFSAYDQAMALRSFCVDAGMDLAGGAHALSMGLGTAMSLQAIWRATRELQRIIHEYDIDTAAAGVLADIERKLGSADRLARQYADGQLSVAELTAILRAGRWRST